MTPPNPSLALEIERRMRRYVRADVVFGSLLQRFSRRTTESELEATLRWMVKERRLYVTNGRMYLPARGLDKHKTYELLDNGPEFEKQEWLFKAP